MASLSGYLHVEHLRFRAGATLAVLLLFTASAAAHSNLTGSRPAANETLTAAPAAVELTFNIAVQPALGSIAVTGPNGVRAERGDPVVSADGKLMRIELEPLGPGRYKVAWRALSADDHVIRGEFAFEIAPGAAAAASEEQATPEPVADPMAGHDHSQMDHSMHEAGINWPQSLVRWLLYLGMMLLAGGLAFRVFVAGPAAGEFGEANGNGLAAFDRRLGSLSAVAALAVLAAGAAALVLQAVTVFGGEIGTGQLYRVISETAFGAPWLLLIASATLSGAAALLFARTRSRSVLWAAFAFSLLMLLAPSLTGHARAAAVDYPLSVPVDWVHLLAAAVWVGGLFQIALGLPALLRGLNGGRRLLALSAVIAGFNKAAIGATVLILLTGLYNSWIHVDSFAALVETQYGQILIAKVAVSLLMVALGGLNAFVLHPRIRMMAAEITSDGRVSDKEAVMLGRAVRVELALAAAVLLLAALLAFLPPAREHTVAASRPAGELRRASCGPCDRSSDKRKSVTVLSATLSHMPGVRAY